MVHTLSFDGLVLDRRCGAEDLSVGVAGDLDRGSPDATGG
jgi:hypothetical protein